MAFFSAASVEGNELSLSEHGFGDLILLVVYRENSTSAPTVPAGWTLISAAGSNSNWFGIYWRRATSSAETSGVWTNATHMACWVGRAANFLIVGTATPINGGTTTTLSYTARSANDLGGATSVLLGAMAVRTNNTDADTAPVGMTRRTFVVGSSVGNIAIHDTGAPVTSWPLINVVANNPVGSRNAIVIEIKNTGNSVVSGSASSIQAVGHWS